MPVNKTVLNKNEIRQKTRAVKIATTTKVMIATWVQRHAAGGDGENRTRVRKRITKAFYERSFCFKIPAASRPKAGWRLW
jgi:hypothetical protein